MQAADKLEVLDDEKQQRIITETLAQHYGFPIRALTQRFEVEANECIYTTADNVEDNIRNKFADREDEVSEMAINQGMVRLETLLESAVDKRCDQLELYFIRNIYTIKPEFLRHIILPHHPKAGFPSKSAADEEYARKLLEERKLFDQELHEAETLALVERKLRKKLKAFKKLKEELQGFAGPGESVVDLEAQAKQLSSQLAEIKVSTDSMLHATDELPQLQTTVSKQEPWTQSREAYLDWAAMRAVSGET